MTAPGARGTLLTACVLIAAGVMAAISPSSPTACRPLAKRLVFSTRVPKEVHSTSYIKGKAYGCGDFHSDWEQRLDAVAQQKWAYYREGTDLEAIACMIGQASALVTGQTNLDASGTAAAIVTQMQNAFALNIGKVIGSHATVARQLDELASIDGLTGVMCIFDDFVVGPEDFGRHVMPLLRCR